MQVQECMTKNPATIRAESSLQKAAENMGIHDFGALPVSKDNKLVGMVTDRDICVRGTAKGFRPDEPVTKVMTEELLYCRASDDVEDVLNNMGAMQVRRLPVVDEQKQLVGIVSIGDLVKARPSEGGKCFAEVAQPSNLHSQTIP